MLTHDELRCVTVFADLDGEALDWLAEHAEKVRLAQGEVLAEAGEPADWLIFNVQGLLRSIDRRGNQDRGIFAVERGAITGMLPRSRMKAFPVRVEAAEPSTVGRLHKQHFDEMLRRIPALDERLAHLMLDRARDSERAQLQQEKLASLGTMAAGLAHELNNPASAARRAAQHLTETLGLFDELATVMLRRVMFKDADGEGNPFQPVVDRMMEEPPQLDALTIGEYEDDLTDWLEELGVPEPWDVAATLAGAGFTRAFLEDFSERLVDDQVVNFLSWLPKDVEMRQLAGELTESTVRISDLVAAMKAYTFMDQAQDKAPTDLHRGLDSTLTILDYKRRRKQVEIVREYGDIPPVPAFGGELNQVWTNLLDNAIAAVPEGEGRIRIVTCHEPDNQTVQVQIIDNGPGIPAEIQGRIFEPFYTTKKQGEGTGLGLDISYRIVTDHHGGGLFVSSVPGETTFHVRLPIG